MDMMGYSIFIFIFLNYFLITKSIKNNNANKKHC
jgi:hypothetical protein